MINATFKSSKHTHRSIECFQVGRGVTLFQSTLYFEGVTRFENNSAENDGAIHSPEHNRIYVIGQVIVVNNTAGNSGGGIYLSYSELKCETNSHLALCNNAVGHKGGGIHIVSLHIDIMVDMSVLFRIPEYTRSMMYLHGNKAKYGGGISYEANAALYIKAKYCSIQSIVFNRNTADYGGVTYVDDNSISGTCSQNLECFFQSTVVDRECQPQKFRTRL